MKLFHLEQPLKWRLKSLLIGIWVLGGVLTLLGYSWAEHNNKIKIEQRTEALIEQAIGVVQKRFEVYQYGLLSTRGAILVAGAADISRKNFERYIGSLDLVHEFPGARGFGFIRKVPVEKEQDFLAQAKADDAPNFSIKTLEPHNKDRFIIQYIYPQADNKEAIGLDIGSENHRRISAITAAVTGEVNLTAPITLVQDKGQARRGFLILLPVYSTNVSQYLPEDRLEATIGWSYAPLIVDEVLFDLGPVLSEISLSLTDKADNTPFFDTRTKKKGAEITELATSREIGFMGRQWVVKAIPLQDMRAQLGLYSSSWIVFFGVLIICLVSVLVLSKGLKAAKWEDDQNSVNFSGFIASALFRNMLKAYVIIMACITVASGYLYLEEEFKEVTSTLLEHVRYSEELVTRQQQNYSEGLNLIKSTPPIIGMIRAEENGYDSVGMLTGHVWQEQLADIFRAYMLSLSDVYQIRLIRANTEGTEIVRVERKGDSIVVAPSADLQKKGDRSYFLKTLKLNNDDVFVSNIEPNVENGKMEIPLRPTRRYSTPIYTPDGRIFAILVINVDVTSLLQEINSLSEVGESIYINDEELEFVWADDEKKLYGSWLGKPYAWYDAFVRTSNFFSVLHDDISVWESDQGDFIAAQLTTTPNYGDSTGQLKFSATHMARDIYQKAIVLLAKQMVVLIALSMIAVVIIYFSWLNSRRSMIANRVKQELDEQRRKDNMFESLTELSPEAMVICDKKGIIILVNSQAEKLFGYDRQQMLGKNISLLVPTSVVSRHDAYVSSYVAKPVNRSLGEERELYSRHADGTEFPVEVSLSPVKVDDRLLIASSIRNVSERKRIESTLKKAIDEAKRASQAKSAFLANMSHEIRTPLNSVIGLTHLLKDADLTASQLNLVSKIQLAGRALLGIVNDILDLAKIEANEINLVQAPCNLRELLDEIYSVFSSQAESKNLKLYLQVDPNVSVWVNTDKKLLQQIITNLLSNAIKFTNDGAVYLRAHCVDSSSGSSSLPAAQQTVCFSIEDTGIGISKETQERIFLPFNQADDGINRRFDGTGLGLSIVSNLCELLGGTIGVESELGKGSRFWTTLPFVCINPEEEFIGDSIVDAINIWVVEHSSKDGEQLESVSRSLGWKVFAVSDQPQLIQEYKTRIKDKKRLPDALLIDWEQPESNGLAILEALSQEPEWKKTPAILVISNHQEEYIRKLDKNNLVQGFLFKPVTPSELFGVVNESVVEQTGDSGRVLDSTKMDAIRAKWLPNVRILVVDDSEMNLEVVGRILTSNGADVVTVNSGEKALAALSQTPDAFDVVLMDVHMPVMDGLETVSHIRNVMELKTLPVIALTAGTTEEERTRALAAGMDDFLTKPIEPSRLILSLRKFVENYRDHAVMIDSIDVDPYLAQHDDWPVIAGISNSVELFQGNLELFEFALKRLFKENEFLESLDIDNLDLGSKEKRLSLAAKIHKLRGGAGMVGARDLYELSSRAELDLRKDNENIEPILSQVTKALSELRQSSAEFLDKCEAIQKQQNEIDLSNVAQINEVELKNLIRALENNDLSAMDLVDTFSQGLQALLGKNNFELLTSFMDELNYRDALELLKSNQKDE